VPSPHTAAAHAHAAHAVHAVHAAKVAAKTAHAQPRRSTDCVSTCNSHCAAQNKHGAAAKCIMECLEKCPSDASADGFDFDPLKVFAGKDDDLVVPSILLGKN